MPERTPAQRYADYRKTFPKRVNARRLELIEKQFSGSTEEEGSRTFVSFPGWEEECERRYHANLTDSEREELEHCTNVVDEWQAKSPWQADQDEFMRDLDERFNAIMARINETK